MEFNREQIIDALQAHLDSWHTENCVVLMPIDPKPNKPSLKDILSALQEQEHSARLLTSEDWENNPNVDGYGCLPAWCERVDKNIGWMPITKRYINARKDLRYWTSRPSDEQRAATAWD